MPPSRHCRAGGLPRGRIDSLPEEIAAQEDRANNSMENLCHALLQFVSGVLQEAQIYHNRKQATRSRSSHATQQAKRRITIAENCDAMVEEKIVEWSVRPSKQMCYTEQALLIHKEMFDIMRRDKEGIPKENTFLPWCRKIASLKIKKASTAESRESQGFKALALNLLSHELTTQQKKERKYRIQWDWETGEIIVTGPQRSWINVMLRKNLGNVHVAYFILNRGLPPLFDAPLRKQQLDNKLLDQMLEEGMHWYASLLHSILERENHPDMADARKLGTLDQHAWRQQRQEIKRQAKQRMAQGKSLAKVRDDKKRSYFDMSATEQQILEDYDTRKSRKVHDEACVQRLPPFRGSLL